MAYHLRGPKPEYPHESHDLNTLSSHFINASAFTAKVKTTPELVRETGMDIPTCYTTIAATHSKFPPLFVNKTIPIDQRTLNFDRIGILYEHGSLYYVVFDIHSSRRTATQQRPQGVFILKATVNLPLIQEWNAVPKWRVGSDGIGATTLADGWGWWHVHSDHVMAMRHMCTTVAVQLEARRQAATEAMAKGKVMDVEEVERQFLQALGKRFRICVDRYFESVDELEKARIGEVKSAWEEFMVDDEEVVVES
jgi:hypothetical protein